MELYAEQKQEEGELNERTVDTITLGSICSRVLYFSVVDRNPVVIFKINRKVRRRLKVIHYRAWPRFQNRCMNSKTINTAPHKFLTCDIYIV